MGARGLAHTCKHTHTHTQIHDNLHVHAETLRPRSHTHVHTGTFTFCFLIPACCTQSQINVTTDSLTSEFQDLPTDNTAKTHKPGHKGISLLNLPVNVGQELLVNRVHKDWQTNVHAKRLELSNLQLHENLALHGPQGVSVFVNQGARSCYKQA